MNKLQVWDLDQTLINSMHRYRNKPGTNSIDLDYWREKATPENIAKDKIIFPAIHKYKSGVFCPETMVVICTARVMSEADYDFVNKNLKGFHFLLSRDGNSDNRSDWQLKRDKLIPLLREVQPTCKQVFDDNVSVLNMFANLGFCCWRSIFDGVRGKIKRYQ